MIKKCRICSCSFKVRGIRRKKYAKYCSLKCKHIGQKQIIPWSKGKKLEYMTANKNKFWNGGISIDPRGYIRIYSPNHPRKDIRNYVFEHHLVMEKKLGRFLKSNERVHHINKVKSDNRVENLILFNSESEHQKYHRNILKEGGFKKGHPFYPKKTSYTSR